MKKEKVLGNLSMMSPIVSSSHTYSLTWSDKLTAGPNFGCNVDYLLERIQRRLVSGKLNWISAGLPSGRPLVHTPAGATTSGL